MGDRLRNWRSGIALVLAVSGLATTSALVWFAHYTTGEWRRATKMSVDRRATEVLVLLASALEHDMTGVQNNVLLPINQQSLTLDPPYDLTERFARAFARFPYPESFFAWRAAASGSGVTYFFNRSDRPPSWDREDRSGDPYPVVTLRNPAAVRPFIEAARRQARYGSRFAVTESRLGGVPYQTVVQFIFNDDGRALLGLVGFTVNLDWAAREYFPDVITQVQRIGDRADDTSVEILDDSGRLVAVVGTPSGETTHSRTFPFFFFNRALWSSLPPDRPPIRDWTARVSAVNDAALVVATRWSELTVILIATAAALSVGGLVLTARAVRTEAALTAMRTDFVSSVTHELKTPLAAICLVADTLARKRYTSPDTVSEYAKLLSMEARRLTRLIDNLLAYARLEEGRQLYSPHAVNVADLVDEVTDRFDLRLAEMGFEVTVDVPPDLPPVEFDRAAAVTVIDNVVDNAIKYAHAGRALLLRARAEGSYVRLEIKDRGEGIPSDETGLVFDKFYRGRTAKSGGSGLGLAIARRVMSDLRGRIDLRSVPGEGTTVGISFPVAEHP